MNYAVFGVSMPVSISGYILLTDHEIVGTQKEYHIRNILKSESQGESIGIA